MGEKRGQMRFDIHPYEGPLPLRFGASEAEVLELLGEPRCKSSNFRRDQIFDYEHMNVGFGRDGVVMHAGFSPGANVLFRGTNVFHPGVFEQMLEIDGAPMEAFGIIVLLNVGITFSGFHDGGESQKAVTAFTRGEYDQLKGRMKPFRF